MSRNIEEEVQRINAQNLIIESPLKTKIEPELNHLRKEIVKHDLSDHFSKNADIYTAFVYPLNRALVSIGNS
ncbi:MAG: hypothetical protein PHR00_00185 [Patescibacteria group bacterium]|nr:hypothetical protein [Patescibacteria group bacterium]